MKITNKNTEHSFNLNAKDTESFFNAKNARGKKINKPEDYIIKNDSSEISSFKFFLCCLFLMALVISSILLYIHLNY